MYVYISITISISIYIYAFSKPLTKVSLELVGVLCPPRHCLINRNNK